MVIKSLIVKGRRDCQAGRVKTGKQIFNYGPTKLRYPDSAPYLRLIAPSLSPHSSAPWLWLYYSCREIIRHFQSPYNMATRRHGPWVREGQGDKEWRKLEVAKKEQKINIHIWGFLRCCILQKKILLDAENLPTQGNRFTLCRRMTKSNAKITYKQDISVWSTQGDVKIILIK